MPGAGDPIVLLGMGLGPLGALPQVSFNNAPGKVTYAGPVAGTIGLYRINVVVPNLAWLPNVTFNDYVSVVVQGRGVSV